MWMSLDRSPLNILPPLSVGKASLTVGKLS
jgi:hypothetical protein